MTEPLASNNRYTWLGVGAFLVIDLPIHFGQCLGYLRLNGSTSACSHDALPSLTPYILAVMVVLIVLWVFSERGRWFARGFANALLITTVLTLGRCTFLWADPVNDLWGSTSRTRSHFAVSRRAVAAQAGWANAMSRRPPDLPRAMMLAGAARNCTFTVPGVDHPFAPTDAEVMSRCQLLTLTYAGSDTVTAPNRYVTPGVTSEQLLGTAESGDPGWRWARDPRDPKRIEVTLDSILDRPWPRIMIDEDGTLTLKPTRKGEIVEVSPAKEFQELRRCLANVPLELKRRRNPKAEAAGYYFEWALVPMVQKLCPALAKRVAPDPMDEGRKAMRLTVARDLPGSKEAVPLAHYSVVLTVESETPFRFTLHATHYGARSYDMTADGDFY